MPQKFKGTGVAIVTPFHREGNIDFKSFERMIEYQITSGIDYIVFLGTTGEAVTLNYDEKHALVNYAIETVAGRVPVVVGIGGNNTQEIISIIKKTSFEGIDAILSVSPYYNKPQQKGIYYHYKNIAAASPVPVIIYNVPSRTASNISAETTLRIAHDFPNVIGIKEASKDLSQCALILRDRHKDFLVISGDDSTTIPLIAMGGNGVISVIANAYPAEFSKMVKHCLQNDFVKARTIYFSLIDLIDAIFADGSPSGIKALLDIKGMVKNNLRLPLVKVNKGLYKHLSTLVEQYEGSEVAVK
ncbi:MAG: 4-hydroxy-tetrahydrodipicolinate synthase [Bacteroidetes bacterium]|nr:4-hydroxy-tetrahydrodipicolinate synthase [Bacteroidota bacterium]